MDETEGLITSSWREVSRETAVRPYHRIIERPKKNRYFWRRKSIRRPKVERLGSKGRRRWRVRMPKIKIRIVSPLRLLARLRDAYVNFMMSLANKSGSMGLAFGPSMVGAPVLVGPKAGVTAGNRVSDITVLNEMEMMYLEYLKRDPYFYRPSLMSPFC